MIHLLNIALAVTLTILTLVMASAQGGYGYHGYGDGQRLRTREESTMIMKSDLSADQAALAQSDADRSAGSQGGTRQMTDEHAAQEIAAAIREKPEFKGMIARSDAEPRPDASAGLLEAAGIVEQSIDQLKGEHVELWIIQVLEDINKRIRARAADRSGK